jgi:hypothetical protein
METKGKKERPMETKGKKRISIRLTPEQQKQIQQAVGKKASTLELTAEELEARIAPFGVVSPRDAASG